MESSSRGMKEIASQSLSNYFYWNSLEIVSPGTICAPQSLEIFIISMILTFGGFKETEEVLEGILLESH
jgi:hypothetical protein